MNLETYSSLGAARQWIEDKKWDGGEHCPCCRQFAKVYRRALNGTMAKTLIKMYKAHSHEWVHVPSFAPTAGGGDFCKLRWWDMIEEEVTLKRDDGGRAGYWRITDQGRQFVNNALVIPSHAFVFDNELIRLDHTTMVRIEDIINKRFNYRELMDS